MVEAFVWVSEGIVDAAYYEIESDSSAIISMFSSHP